MSYVTPIIDGRLKYLWHAHPRPWISSVASLDAPRYEGGAIKVDFHIKHSDAKEGYRYNPEDGGCVIDVCDSNGVPIFESRLVFEGKEEISGTIGIR